MPVTSPGHALLGTALQALVTLLGILLSYAAGQRQERTRQEEEAQKRAAAADDLTHREQQDVLQTSAELRQELRGDLQVLRQRLEAAEAKAYAAEAKADTMATRVEDLTCRAGAQDARIGELEQENTDLRALVGHVSCGKAPECPERVQVP